MANDIDYQWLPEYTPGTVEVLLQPALLLSVMHCAHRSTAESPPATEITAVHFCTTASFVSCKTAVIHTLYAQLKRTALSTLYML
jgi:hypothetical protein